MRSLFFDELYPEEIASVKKYLSENANISGIEGLYWIFLPLEYWNQEQRDNASGEEAQKAYHLAVEVGVDWVRFEMLIRAQGMDNYGGGGADEAQSLFILRWATEMARNLNIKTCL